MTGELYDLDAHRPHWQGTETCRSCGHQQHGIVIATADLTRLECGGCGRMTATMSTCEPIDQPMPSNT